MYDIVLNPIREYLPSPESREPAIQLYIVIDRMDDLLRVPFAVLKDESGTMLIENFAICMASSLHSAESSLKQFLRYQNHIIRRKEGLIMAFGANQLHAHILQSMFRKTVHTLRLENIKVFFFRLEIGKVISRCVSLKFL